MEKEIIPQEIISEPAVERVETKKETEKEREPVLVERDKKVEVREPVSEIKKPVVASTPADEVKKISKLAPTKQVEILVSLALEKGLKKAIAVAQEIDNPAVLDALHDTLMDKRYQELIDKKIIKP